MAIADLDVLALADVDVVFAVELLEDVGVGVGEVLAEGGEVGGGVGAGFDSFQDEL